MEPQPPTIEENLLGLASFFGVVETPLMISTREDMRNTTDLSEVVQLINFYQKTGADNIQESVQSQLGQQLLNATAYLSADLPKEALRSLRGTYTYTFQMGFDPEATLIEDAIIDLENSMKASRITLPLKEDFQEDLEKL